MKSTLSFRNPSTQQFLQLALPVLAALLGLAASQFGAQIIAEGLFFTSLKFRAAYWALVALGALFAGLSLYAWLGGAQRLLGALTFLQTRLSAFSALAPFALGVLTIAYPLLLFSFYGNFLLEPFPRLAVFVFAILAGASLLATWRRQPWLRSLVESALLFAVVYCAATFFNLVSTYPFSLEWSEISRYYQASFYFSKQVYGIQLPLPVTHPSRYLLQSLPFLIADSPLWLHRFWQALLWVALPLATAWILARRLNLGVWRWIFIGWSFLSLMQGAVFYHLLPCVFIVLWGFDKGRPWRSFLFVVLASIWAGISRVNWLPLPGALAALLYLLEVKPTGKRGVFAWSYLWPPALFGLGGLLVATGAYALYIANSGVGDSSQFGSAFTSALLWQRLMPNGAFPPGVLLGIALVSAPLLAVIWLRERSQKPILGIWRALGVFALVAVFFIGGLVVSVKIGGGTNLHNMDAYLVLLWVLASTLLFGAVAPEARNPTARLALPAWLTAAAVSVPILFAVYTGGPLNLPPRSVVDQALAQIRQLTEGAAANGSEVLFISQRHLLTFHMVEGIPLVHEYEKLFLMEMAISNNQAYLGRFWDDIDDQRFAYIITDPLNTNIYEEHEDTLSAENNAWVRQISKPVLCAYEALVTYPELGIQVLQPRLPKCGQ
jgi:hypothetical protein